MIPRARSYSNLYIYNPEDEETCIDKEVKGLTKYPHVCLVA